MILRATQAFQLLNLIFLQRETDITHIDKLACNLHRVICTEKVVSKSRLERGGSWEFESHLPQDRRRRPDFSHDPDDQYTCRERFPDCTKFGRKSWVCCVSEHDFRASQRLSLEPQEYSLSLRQYAHNRLTQTLRAATQMLRATTVQLFKQRRAGYRVSVPKVSPNSSAFRLPRRRSLRTRARPLVLQTICDGAHP